jgi:hypothetical protein
MTQLDFSDPKAWAQSWFGNAELGDQRRTRRLVQIAGALAEHVGCAPAKACGQRAADLEGANRFIRNPSFHAREILEAGLLICAKTVQDLPVDDEYLAIQDSTGLSYAHSAREELGDMGGPANSFPRGWHVHTTLIYGLGRIGWVGLGDQDWLLRKEEHRGQRHQRKQRAYEEKESYKWESAHRRLTARMGEEVMKRIITVGDSESDIYEFLNYFAQQRARFVVRAARDRRLAETEEQRQLWAQLANTASVGSRQVEVQQRQGRCARTATVVLRSRRVKLRRPESLQKKGLAAELEINVVYAKEEEPPVGEEGLEWMLLTSEAIGTLEQVNRVMDHYEKRWQIEEFHKAWKSGTKVEGLRQQSAENLQKVAVIFGFIATRLLHLKNLMEKQPELPCTQVLREMEWKVLWSSVEKKLLPVIPPNALWAYRALARLAHWTDTKGTGRASWQTLWQGWQILSDRLRGYHLALQISRGEM